MKKTERTSRKTRCPICYNMCSVAADGKSGYCRSMKKRWKKELLTETELKKLKPGPIQHEELPGFLLDIMRWTFKITGRFIVPTLEQWELGFMRDMHVDKQVGMWHRLSFAFISYHQRKRLPLRSHEEETRLIGGLITQASSVAKANDTESKFLRQCWTEPDGWACETARMPRCSVDAWSPPPGYENWPHPGI